MFKNTRQFESFSQSFFDFLSDRIGGKQALLLSRTASTLGLLFTLIVLAGVFIVGTGDSLILHLSAGMLSAGIPLWTALLGVLTVYANSADSFPAPPQSGIVSSIVGWLAGSAVFFTAFAFSGVLWHMTPLAFFAFWALTLMSGAAFVTVMVLTFRRLSMSASFEDLSTTKTAAEPKAFTDQTG